MDIAKLSMDMSGAKVMTDISMKMLKMSLDQMKDVGNLISALSAATSAPISIDPTIGQHLDVTV